MKSILPALILFIVPCVGFAQNPSPSTGNASTKADCSPAVTGSNNNFKFSCGVGKEQGEKIIALLNQMLSKDNTTVVIDKLNELLKRTNPNGTVVTYDCVGMKRTSTPGMGASSMEGDTPAMNLKSMVDLVSANRFDLLRDECLRQIELKPEWLTPRLFCALAYKELKDTTNAKLMLDYYDSNVGKAYDMPYCRNISELLHRQIQ
jgi:hypothetical protein